MNIIDEITIDKVLRVTEKSVEGGKLEDKF